MSILSATPLPSLLLGAVLGLIAGSFLAALVTRWPEGRSIRRGRSVCDACGRTLDAHDLIPLLSALVLSGRCRTCYAPIDALHWRMEVVGALLGIAAVMLAPVPYAFGWMLLGWLLLALAVLDARHYWLPNALTLPLIFSGLTIGPLVMGTPLQDAAIGAATGYGTLLTIALLYRRIRGREGLGLGDAKLLGGLGAWFGWQALPSLLLIASLMALVWALGAALITRRQLNGGDMLPFGVFLCTAVPPFCFARTFLW